MSVPMIDNGTGRAVEEWIGATPDSVPPPRVRMRILERYNRRCYLSDRPIRAGDSWDVEHILALSNGGENRESNMAPALKEPHKLKTRLDRKIKAKNDRVKKRHFGIQGRKRKMGYRRFDGTVVAPRWE